MISVGKVIKKYRKKHKLTQKDLAKTLRVSLRAVSYWEEDSKYPRQDLVIDKLQELIPELRGRKELRDGSVRLQEAVGGHGEPVDAWLVEGLKLTDERSDRLSVEYGNKEVMFRLKVG